MLSRVNICRALAALAVMLSGILFAMDSRSNMHLCGFAGTCDEVRSSEFAKWFGFPLPIWGLIFFGIVIVMTMVNFRYDSLIRKIISVAILIASTNFLVIQFVVLKKICEFCLAIDVIGIILGWQFYMIRLNLRANSFDCFRFLWLLAIVVLFFMPFSVFLVLADPPPPSPVLAQWIPGKINIIEVTDFDCEYCQKTELILESVKNSPDVNFVRIVAPMPKHANARVAGRAFLAAREQALGEQMATELFRAKDRSRASCRMIAVKLGLRLEDFDRCMDDQNVDRQFDETIAWAREAGAGLPMIWVNLEFFGGTPESAKFEDAINTARRAIRSK